MRIKLIKTTTDYQEALDMVRELMTKDPEPDSIDGQKLALLSSLIEDYENVMFPDHLPDPIDAIKFRMEQQNLTPKDLIPFIGSRSKVSEILSKKRTLTLNMIKSLQVGLGIPAKVLLNQEKNNTSTNDYNYDLFPIIEMIKRKYIDPTISKNKKLIKESIDQFLKPINEYETSLALMKKVQYKDTKHLVNPTSFLVWAAQVVKKANITPNSVVFDHSNINVEFIKKIAKLSINQNAIKDAIETIKKIGVDVVIEPHMPNTYLDGATIMLKNRNPIIGLTIRKDTLENFWFTLIHELSHVLLHYNKGIKFILDNDLGTNESIDLIEKEANEVAIECMIPKYEWIKSPASILPSEEAAFSLARKLNIHPSIVVGKMRYENKFFSFLNDMTGNHKVHKEFPEIVWNKNHE